MSYQVLSRKWRPQSFGDVVGQAHVTQTIQNAIKLERIGHGYIFTGPRGVGKTTVARVLAKALNCKNPQDNNPCNTCTHCEEITDGRNMDVLELDGASNRGIDEIRELRESVKYPPTSGKYRVYIIDEVHMLTKEAFNALLKTLEEPPAHVVFILATTDPHKVPQTILSRTQRFDFRRLSPKLISNHLIDILNRENIKFEAEAIHLIAKKADGSMRDSLSLLDQVIAYSGDKLEVEPVRSSLGIIHDSLYVNLFSEIATKNVSLIIKELDGLFNAGHSINDFISGFNEVLRNALIVASGVDVKSLHSEITDMVSGSNSVFQKMDLLRMLELSMNFETKLRYVQQPQISLEALFIKLASMDSCIVVRDVLSGNIEIDTTQNSEPVILVEKSRQVIQETSEVTQKVEENISKPTSEPVIVNKPPVENEEKIAEPKPEIDLTLQKIIDGWGEVIIETEKINAKISNLLEEVKLQNFSNTVLSILLTRDQKFHAKSLQKDSSKIEIVLQEIYGSKIKLNFTIEESSASQKDEKKQVNEGDKEHPLFMKTLETFEGEVLR
ncbi:MAG: DNA polymerase III subunit gamma/tau [Candidatus Marinimicrobia bacterium]|nr:DNA polymerase III subunit gamma/tau [Candidatus Neomarinimicrobiota bacterium]